jgi:hypothetical protein
MKPGAKAAAHYSARAHKQREEGSMSHTLSQSDRDNNDLIVYGDFNWRRPYFAASVKATTDDDGHIVAPCTDCGKAVTFDVEFDGDFNGVRMVGYTSFHAVDRSEIIVEDDHVLCNACAQVPA